VSMRLYFSLYFNKTELKEINNEFIDINKNEKKKLLDFLISTTKNDTTKPVVFYCLKQYHEKYYPKYIEKYY
jgi:hypothetical protein